MSKAEIEAFLIIWLLGVATIVEACHVCSRTDSAHKMSRGAENYHDFPIIFFYTKPNNVGCFHKNAVNKETCRIFRTICRTVDS